MSVWIAVQLLKELAKRHQLELPDVEGLSAQLQRVDLRAREAAFHQGEACPYVFVVRSGLLKQLYVKEDGSEWIKSFAGPGDLFACLKAITQQSNTTFASVAIEPSVVERIDYRLIERRAESSVSWQKALRLVFQKLAEIKVQREHDLLTLSARELYANLARSRPDWIDRMPQKDLAGFLGVTPVGLNRIIRGAGAGHGRSGAGAARVSRPRSGG